MLPELLPEHLTIIFEAGGFKTAAVAILVNREWHAAALPVLEATNPLKDIAETTQGQLQELLVLDPRCAYGDEKSRV